MLESSKGLLNVTDLRAQLADTQRRLDDELERSRQMERALALRNAALDAGTSHFMIADARTAKRKIVYVNRPLARAHGYEPEELIGRSVGVLVDACAFEPEEVLAMDAELAAGRPYRAEVPALRRDGTTFWLGFTSIALRDERGEICNIVTVAADITSRLEAERKRRELQEQLIGEMRERERMAIELRLAQKLESVGRLAAGLAHEINTPIQYVSDGVHFLRGSLNDLIRLVDTCRSVIAGGSGSLDAAAVASIAAVEQEIDYEFLRAEVPRACERTLEGTDRVAGLVRAMKEFAHPDASEHSPADLNRALDTTLVVCRNEYKYVAQVTTDLAQLPLIPCNIGELNQVFLNLIVNAAHAVQDSGKDAAEGKISISTRIGETQVEIAVSDNGCGIAAENLDRIFDPFFTTKEIGRGTGQGLAIARAIVAGRHGGNIRVESQVGVGTTFTVVLPAGGSRQPLADA